MMNNWFRKIFKQIEPSSDILVEGVKPTAESNFDVENVKISKKEYDALFEKQKPFEVTLPANKKSGGNFDSYSQTWSFIESRLKKKLDKLRMKNDTRGLGIDKTAGLRGQIHEIKSMLQIPEEVRKENAKINKQ